ncbi:LacI family DNA-binding transcriptional regulator [Cellulomonas persica]|uniref:LacI family transcriptional regulator n=1 Tax=Cellulomonas persica TaxID=76861 RepID=A0A510US30_9CELL|nr:LacI family DNA-binding transcriptional regulator [Cellulomonas persica]GEK17464.1 LacI family transcriptional regulator [Cellulomonas persica]
MSTDTGARPPAMSDVALAAGVSHQTVSRVLNGHPSVRPETRLRVQDAIARLGYRRNSAARALVTRRSDTLGVVTPASALYGPTSTLVAFEEAAREAGWYVSVATMRRFTADSMRAAVEHFLDHGVDALVVIAPTSEVASAVQGLDVPVPVVLISSAIELREREGVLSVGVDQRLGARLATRHLLARGHTRVLHVAGPQDWFDAQDRLAGWREECEAAGVTAPKPVVAGWSADSGYEVGRKLAAGKLPEAIFAANDQLALGLEHAFWDAGVRVGQDVAIVGFDDEVGAAHYLPPLTTVRQDFVRLGSLAIDVLRQALGGLTGREAPRLVPPEIVVRRSSGV